MNIITVILILIILMCAVTGFKHGVIKEGISTIMTIIVFVVSYLFKGYIGNILCLILPFYNLNGLTSLNILIYQMIGFCIIFSLLMIIYGIIMKLTDVVQKIVNMTIILTLPSALLGGLIGIIKGYIVAFIFLLVVSIPLKDFVYLSESNLAQNILTKSPLSAMTSDITNTIEEVYNLNEEILNDKIDKNDANLQIVDIMLKYNAVEKDSVEKLVKFKKLKVDGIKEVLDKYE